MKFEVYCRINNPITPVSVMDNNGLQDITLDDAIMMVQKLQTIIDFINTARAPKLAVAGLGLDDDDA